MLDELMQLLKDQVTRNEKLVAKMTPEIKEKHKRFVSENMKLKQEIDNRLEELAMKARHAVKMEFMERVDAVEDRHNEFWNMVYNELGLDPSNNYRIETKESAIYQLSEDVEEEEEVDDPFTEFLKRKRGNHGMMH